ncbi:MAG TPA: ester cyclase [Rubrobacteraceae bacterium]|nr:ester cyclase [Rubrobacteraceae bacterium]
MSEENKAIARRALEEVFSGQGNLDVADELFAPNYVGHDPASPGDIRGPEGAKEFAGMYRSAFPDVQMSVEDQVAEGEKVVTRWIASGTHLGEIMGIAPSGNRVTVTGTSIERIVDGKIVETWDNYDALGMMQQIGAIPSPEHQQQAQA